jgi:hypothetical protein
VYAITVYTISVKNITLSAEESLIVQARRTAADQNTTLNAAFREWLASYTTQKSYAEQFDDLMERTKYVKIDRKYTREEMNER